jgi:hypothetical protein
VHPVITDKFLSILATKILPPRRVPGLIRCERLLDLIDQVEAKALTVIRAAVYGAAVGVGTTLLLLPHAVGHLRAAEFAASRQADRPGDSAATGPGQSRH